MEFLLWLKCWLRGGHNPDTLMVLQVERGWIDGMVPVRTFTCQCASCGAVVRRVA